MKDNPKHTWCTLWQVSRFIIGTQN